MFSHPPWLLPLLLCSAQPCCRHSCIPVPFSTSFASQGAGGDGGTVTCHTKPVVLALEPATSPCHSCFLTHTRCFLCVWQLHPSSLSLGRESWSPPRDMICPRAAGTRFEVVLGHVHVKGWRCCASAQPCFSKSVVWPYVPPTVLVVSPSDLWADFEANGSLCNTWGVVLVFSIAISTFVRESEVSS